MLTKEMEKMWPERQKANEGLQERPVGSDAAEVKSTKD